MSSDGQVGREGELAVLRAAFDAVATGRPTIVLMVGVAGIGKTRLADEAAVRARAAGMLVLPG
jgi:predicted ATPase